MKTCYFPGRYQPLHDGHVRLMRMALQEGHNVCVGIRDTRQGPNNPYTVSERVVMLEHEFPEEFADGRMTWNVIPDQDCELDICHGRKVGWGVRCIELDEATEGISATAIRKRRHPIIWLTGLPCSGKTTLGEKVAAELGAELLDGDDLRGSVFSKGVGFDKDARRQHLLRTGYLAQRLSRYRDVVCCFVSPHEDVRAELPIDILVHVHCSVTVCAERDVKGMYAKAIAGAIQGFTGVGAAYEEPLNPDVVVRTDTQSTSECVTMILEARKRYNPKGT